MNQIAHIWHSIWTREVCVPIVFVQDYCLSFSLTWVSLAPAPTSAALWIPFQTLSEKCRSILAWRCRAVRLQHPGGDGSPPLWFHGRDQVRPLWRSTAVGQDCGHIQVWPHRALPPTWSTIKLLLRDLSSALTKGAFTPKAMRFFASPKMREFNRSTIWAQSHQTRLLKAQPHQKRLVTNKPGKKWRAPVERTCVRNQPLILGSRYLKKERKEYGEHHYLFRELCLDGERFQLHFRPSGSQFE